MIRYGTDGATLKDDAGNTASPLDGKKYSEMLAIMDQQSAAASENAHAADNYAQQLANAQTSINAGRTAAAPPKPLQHVVSDSGASTYVPFVPPLADLIPPAPAQGSTTGGVIAQTGVDTQAIMYAMVTAIYRKMFPTS